MMMTATKYYHTRTPAGQVPPVLAMVRKPVKTLLVGEELAAHQRELERVKRLKEENAQRKRREEELAAVRASHLVYFSHPCVLSERHAAIQLLRLLLLRVEAPLLCVCEIALYCTEMHCTTWYCALLYCTALCKTALYFLLICA